MHKQHHGVRSLCSGRHLSQCEGVRRWQPHQTICARLRQQADHVAGMLHHLEEYLSKEAHTLSEKATKEVRSDIQMLKDLLAKWRQ